MTQKNNEEYNKYHEAKNCFFCQILSNTENRKETYHIIISKCSILAFWQTKKTKYNSNNYLKKQKNCLNLQLNRLECRQKTNLGKI